MFSLCAHIPIEVVRIILGQLGVWVTHVLVDAEDHSCNGGGKKDDSDDCHYYANGAANTTYTGSCLFASIGSIWIDCDE